MTRRQRFELTLLLAFAVLMAAGFVAIGMRNGWVGHR